MSLKSRLEQLETMVERLGQSLTASPDRDLPLADWLPKVSPSYTWTWDHLVHIRENLDLVAANEIKRLMIFCPPRHGKSELVTVRFPAWYLERHPDRRVIIGSYNQLLADRFSRKVRRIAAQRIALSPERKAVSDWETLAGGGLRAVGVGSGVTGQGGNLIIIDDPTKSREEANSEAYRAKVWDWFTDDLYTRLEPGAAMVLIMTRWHTDDLAGRILASPGASEWTVINLPALAEAGDPLGRSEGEALCPERYDEQQLATIREALGSSFTALYQQRPAAQEGELFKREWWRYYDAPPAFRRIVQSWDTSFKTSASNDYSCCTTWGETDTGFYLLDVWKRRVEFPELKRMVQALAETYKPHAVLVEDKASGQSLIQELQRDTSLPILPVKVDADKFARAAAVTPLIEAGRVHLPQGAPWLAEFLDSLATFPNGAHDDDVDSVSQALGWLSPRRLPHQGLFDMYRLEAEALTARSAPGSDVRLRVPPGRWQVRLLSGKTVTPDEGGIIRVSESDAAPLRAAGFIMEAR
jgi:predicted phage terminase large subunit-like protein